MAETVKIQQSIEDEFSGLLDSLQKIKSGTEVIEKTTFPNTDRMGRGDDFEPYSFNAEEVKRINRFEGFIRELEGTAVNQDANVGRTVEVDREAALQAIRDIRYFQNKEEVARDLLAGDDSATKRDYVNAGKDFNESMRSVKNGLEGAMDGLAKILTKIEAAVGVEAGTPSSQATGGGMKQVVGRQDLFRPR